MFYFRGEDARLDQVGATRGIKQSIYARKLLVSAGAPDQEI